jgi:hypothetical protein
MRDLCYWFFYHSQVNCPRAVSACGCGAPDRVSRSASSRRYRLMRAAPPLGLRWPRGCCPNSSAARLPLPLRPSHPHYDEEDDPSYSS